MSFEGERFKVHETSEEGALSLLDNANEDADIHPNELSGDENGEQSVLASNLEGQKSSKTVPIQASSSPSPLWSRP